jgi:hypothetical protein
VKQVNKQIEKYTAFAQKHGKRIIDAYNDVIEVKRKLKLLPSDSVLSSAKIESIESKPILAVAAYYQEIINAMKDRVKKDLNTDGLAALYFFGSTVDLNLDRDTNKELFIQS